MTVLIVDDQEMNLYLLESLLKGNGYDVLSATNGSEALNIVRKGGVELVISDILMPVMDGFELCRRLKKDENLKNIPVIFYTATYTGPQDEQFARKIGANRYLLKPTEPDFLLEAVRETLQECGSCDHETPLPAEEEVLKLYNERLVRKLEQNMLQLEAETKALREAQATLRISERKYRRLHESMKDGFIYVDMRGRILETNESLRNMLDYTEDELSRLTWIDLTPEKWRAQEQEIVKNRILSEGVSEVYEKEYFKKDGTVIPVELKTFLVRGDSGENEGMWAIVRDLTERRKAEKTQRSLEAQLYQSQKMESVGRLAGGVAHDFNNLLSIIMGYAEMALDSVNETHPLHGALTQIYQAGERAGNLTRQLLAFSRKQVLETKIVDANTIVSGFEKLLRRLIGEDIKTTFSLTPEKLTVNADISQIEQVLMNLAVNARDAMPDGGKLLIQTSMKSVDISQSTRDKDISPGNYAVIEVSDNGCGMDSYTQERIFEPFFTTKSRDKGTGLGLATCYGIVKQHVGGIGVYSEPGEGTTFRVYLPISEETADTDSVSKNYEAVATGTETILVVEDDASVRKLVTEIISRQGFNVLETGTPGEAIALAANHVGPIHLVLTDVIMPGLRGPEVYRKIHARHPEARVLYMSGYPEDFIIRKGGIRQGDKYLKKPFTAKELLEACRQSLGTGEDTSKAG